MIDFTRIGDYQENNRIEAKLAAGGLPESIWETYSAFANTVGGIILLGVRELPDHTLVPEGLADPEAMRRLFFQKLRDPKKVSTNILKEDQAEIIPLGNKRILAIQVPRADRRQKPVYINGDVYAGSYRRDGEGDYHCSDEEIAAMLRDRGDRAPDKRILEHLSGESLDRGTLTRYKEAVEVLHPGHPWLKLPGPFFLERIGAMGRGTVSRALHPTAAGLLMFGKIQQIRKAFPHFYLEYREEESNILIFSGQTNWSGNLFDFYQAASRKLMEGAKGLGGQALCEALANAVFHGDYDTAQGLMVRKRKDKILISNPGSFRVPGEEKKTEGFCDPRNAALTKMFLFAGIGEGKGRGLKRMQEIWEKEYHRGPILKETFGPDTTTMEFELQPREETGNGRIVPGWMHCSDQELDVLNYLMDRIEGSPDQIQRGLSWESGRTEGVLMSLKKKDLITETPQHTYKLKR